MPPRSPFAGGPLIRQGFQQLRETEIREEEREQERERQEVLNDLRRLRLREGTAGFRRRFDYQPEGAETEVPAGPQSRAPSLGEQVTEGARGEAAAESRESIAGASDLRSAFEAERGRVAPGEGAGGAEGASATSIGEEVKRLRSTGGSELMPGDVREEESLARTLGNAQPATMPAEEAEGRISLPESMGGGSVSRTSPEVQRERERRERLTQTMQRAFPQADPERVQLAAMTGDTSVLQTDPEAAGDRLAETAANVWMNNPEMSARDVMDQTGVPLDVIGRARERIEAAEPGFFEADEETEGEEPPFLNTQPGQRAFGLFQENVNRDPMEVARMVGTENLQGVLDARERVREAKEAAEGDDEEPPPAPNWNQAWNFVQDIFGERDFDGNVIFPDALEINELRTLADQLAAGDSAARSTINDFRDRLEESDDADAPESLDEMGGDPWYTIFPWWGGSDESGEAGGEGEGGGAGKGEGQEFSAAVRAKARRLVNAYDGDVQAALSDAQAIEEPTEQDRQTIRYLQTEFSGGG